MGITNKTLAFLVFVTIIVSVTGTFLSLIKIKSFNEPSITGLSTTPTGNVTLTITSFASIIFDDSAVSWGAGYVNTSGGYTKCKLNTTGGYPPASGCANFTQEITGLILVNDGQKNVTVQLASNVSAGANFIGGTNPVFKYNVTNNESLSCLNWTGSEGDHPWDFDGSPGSWGDVNTTDSGTIICPKLQFSEANDSLKINLHVEIPYDAPASDWAAKLTATGTQI